MEHLVLDQLQGDLQAEDTVGLLLAVQLGQSPHELRAIVRTNHIVPGGVQPIQHYLITLRNTLEHQVTLGPFDKIALSDDHILLQHHNEARWRVFTSSAADRPQAVIDALETAYVEMFGSWRHSTLNAAGKLVRVLETGYGTLGEMPEPFARRVSEVLTEFGISHNLMAVRPPLDPRVKLLIIDTTYFVAYQVEFELLTP